MIALFRSLFAPPRHLILVVLAIWLGLWLSEKRAERHGIARDALNNLVFYGLFGYLLGGRLLFVLANLYAFRDNPLSIFSINLEMFDVLGALVTALLADTVYGQQHKLRPWPVLDALTPLFATLAIGLSLSHLAAGTAFGKPTNVPWGIELWNASRHPSQIYEFLAALFIFILLWLRKADSLAGSDFLFFTALTAGARLFLEAFRGDSVLIFGGLRLAQVIAWLVLASAWITRELLQKQAKL